MALFDIKASFEISYRLDVASYIYIYISEHGFWRRYTNIHICINCRSYLHVHNLYIRNISCNIYIYIYIYRSGQVRRKIRRYAAEPTAHFNGAP